MDTLFERLRAVDTTTLSDVGKQLRVMDAGLRSVRVGLKLVGRAVTVAAADDLMPVLDGLARAGGGDVLVVDGGGSARALAGELFGSEALRCGLAGIVIDGACRDTNQLRQLPLPFYAAASAPARRARRPSRASRVPCAAAASTSRRATCWWETTTGSSSARPPNSAAVLDAAEALQATEASMLSAIQAGESLFSRLERHAGGLRFKD